MQINDTWWVIFQKCIIHIYYYIKRLVVTSLEDIPNLFLNFLHGGHLDKQMASADREYSPFYNSFFLAIAVYRPSILFVSCTMTSIECNNSEIIFLIDFQIIIKT